MRKVIQVCVAWLLLLLLDTTLKHVADNTSIYWPRKKCTLLLLAFVINSFVTDQAIWEVCKNRLVIYLTRIVIVLSLVTNSTSYLISSNSQFINDLAKFGFLTLGYIQMIGTTLIAKYLLTKSRILTPSRKLILQSFLLATLVTMYGVYNCVSDWQITQVSYQMQNFKAVNFKIVFVSDIHIGAAIGEGDVELLIAKINTLKPDLVLLGGDLIDQSVERAANAIAHLRNLTPNNGVYFAPGNHDYKSDIEELVKELRKLGVKSLMNQKVRIFAGDSWFYLAGVEDLGATKGHKLDFELALDGRMTNRETVLLTHRPSTADMALSKHRNIDLILCGHTHGGESFPINILIYLTNEYFAGEYELTNSRVIVSVGAMYYNIPLRHVFKREILVININ